jgi:DNA-binding transcriptional LysR family regulator
MPEYVQYQILVLLIKFGYTLTMDLDAKPYRAFVRIAELGSFSRAASDLCVSQPALSAQMRELERRLGFLLFRRHNRRITLTAEGAIFLDRARRLIVETEWLNQAARDIRENELRIGTAHHSADIPERCNAIYGFLAAYPKLPVSAVGRSPLQLLTDLRNGDIDVAVTLDIGLNQGNSVHDPAELAGLQRNVLGRRAVGLAVPSAQWSSERRVDLAGREVATIGRAHGVAIAEAVNRAILDSGGRLCRPAEGDARSVLRYAAARGTFALDLGWFGPVPEGHLSVSMPQWDLWTELVILCRQGERRAAADQFVAYALASVGVGIASPAPLACH